jgi:hypothetical protein
MNNLYMKHLLLKYNILGMVVMVIGHGGDIIGMVDTVDTAAEDGVIEHVLVDGEVAMAVMVEVVEDL